jgi:hypothetical protein
MGRRGWLLWTLALVTVPIPYTGIGSGFAPVAWLAAVALVGVAVGVTEQGAMPWILAAIFGGQAAVAATVLFWAIRAIRRGLERIVPAGQEPWVAILLAGLLVVVPIFRVYRSGLANTQGWATLPNLWRLARVDEAPGTESPPPEPIPGLPTREPCADRTPLRRPFFGDLHVHTRLSLDASTQGTRNGPADAYRFARGETVGLQPYDDAGRPTRRLRLDRPLDFAVVTDHAELFGEVRICETPGLPGHDSLACRVYRHWPRLAFYLMNARASMSTTPTRHRFCGPGDIYCLEAALTPWREVQDAAEAAYDRTAACRFTTFVGYEWTGAPDSRNLHRNVIFNERVVPDRPISYYEAPNPTVLWRQLRKHCIESLPGCDAIAIPHNSNLSGNTMFEPPPGQTMTAEHAAAWAQAEPLVEIMQHKGDSECGLDAADEECSFEKLPYDRFSGKYNRWMAKKPKPASFVRHALGAGLAWHAKVGTNPFHFGIVASTDTHLGTPGAVDERHYPGHGGAGVPALTRLPAGFPDDVEFNPGGLAVLWAEENSRDALFAAMKRREAYGTSGPRLIVRLFGGWDFGGPMCGSETFAERGYARGVPMGGTLAAAPPDGPVAPTFAVWAVRDAGTPRAPGTPLERIQIVKGWLAGGEPRERVIDVAGTKLPETIDPRSCVPPDDGFESLCESWTDPDFDPESPAYWYVRVLQRPSCRWTTWICNQRGVDCADRSTIAPGLEACCDGSVPKTIRERAWTSPIWYVPPALAPPAPAASAMPAAPSTPPGAEAGGDAVEP